MRIRVVTEAFDPHAEAVAFAASLRGAGAFVSFVGYCRAESHDGPVKELVLEQYPGFTEKEIGRLAAEVAVRFACLDLCVIHRVGAILPGEAIVLVAALAKHRAEAFGAAEVLIDYLKTDAPLWKKEIGPDNQARWIEPREEDHARRLRHGDAV